jgi:hypothetical protein
VGCPVSSRPHSESADHAALGLSMRWDFSLNLGECLLRCKEVTFFALAGYGSVWMERELNGLNGYDGPSFDLRCSLLICLVRL